MFGSSGELNTFIIIVLRLRVLAFKTFYLWIWKGLSWRM